MVPIRATVTIQGDTMSVDLSESSPQVTGFINSSYANTRSLAHAAIMYMAPADVPKNEGSMRAVTIIAPRGLIVNPNPPAPVCMSTNHCGEEIIEAIFKAWPLPFQRGDGWLFPAPALRSPAPIRAMVVSSGTSSTPAGGLTGL
jgi:N-methylhydantoinase B/oxoprolinase/acetone carboxylase alpha subunit